MATQGPVREGTQRSGVTAQGNQVGTGEAETLQAARTSRPRVRSPDLPTETPWIEPGHLNPGGHHAATHRVCRQRGTNRRVVPIIKQPRTC